MEHTGLPGVLRAVGWAVVLLMVLALAYAAGISWIHWPEISV